MHLKTKSISVSSTICVCVRLNSDGVVMSCSATNVSEILVYKTTPVHRKKELLASMSMKMKLFIFENCSENTTNDGVRKQLQNVEYFTSISKPICLLMCFPGLCRQLAVKAMHVSWQKQTQAGSSGLTGTENRLPLMQEICKQFS